MEGDIMAYKLNLDVETIYNTEFPIEFKGYSPTVVDSVLDQVMEDYETFQSIAKQLTDRIGELEAQNAALRAKLIEAEGKAKALEESSTANVSNVDILKRISRLEQEVFNNKR